MVKLLGNIKPGALLSHFKLIGHTDSHSQHQAAAEADHHPTPTLFPRRLSVDHIPHILPPHTPTPPDRSFCCEIWGEIPDDIAIQSFPPQSTAQESITPKVSTATQTSSAFSFWLPLHTAQHSHPTPVPSGPGSGSGFQTKTHSY